jgi:predicted CXXCH cytochrome family protein
MLKRWLFRIGVGLAFALPAMLLSVALAQADTTLPAQQPPPSKCAVCHEDFQAAWESGSHGKAVEDPVFKEAWEKQGKPEQCLTCHTTGYDAATGEWQSDGVTCEACHAPFTENHPEEPMPADRSPALCGTCHTETLFEWQVSQHRQADLACVDCHDSHGTTLKEENSSKLCASCHRERASNYTHTAHSQMGLTCSDCHLAPLDSTSGEGHAARDHSFNVRLSTCNSCHAYQMHDPVQVHQDQPTPTPVDALASVETLSATALPEPVSPLGYALLAGLVGLAGGIILAPWLERWYRKNSRDGK